MNSSPSHRFSTVSYQFVKFGPVSGADAVVDLTVMIIIRELGLSLDINEHDVFMNLFRTRWNIRYSRVYAALVFVVTSIWNFQLDRPWTFRTDSHLDRFRQFFPLLFAGVSALVVGLIAITLLTNPTSPLILPMDIFGDSIGLRNHLYWANLVGVVLDTPASFVLNRIWVF